MDEADKLCDTIAIIDNGTIIVKGTPIELKDSIGADTILLGFPDMDIARNAEALLIAEIKPEKIQTNNNVVYVSIKDGERMMPELLRLLDANNLKVQSMTLSKPSLDDVFLRYTGRSLREDET